MKNTTQVVCGSAYIEYSFDDTYLVNASLCRLHEYLCQFGCEYDMSILYIRVQNYPTPPVQHSATKILDGKMIFPKIGLI
jgi:hypothetical protein